MRYTYPDLIDFELSINEISGRELRFEIYDQNPAVTGRLFFEAADGFLIESVDHIELSAGNNKVFLIGSSKARPTKASRVYKTAEICRRVHDRMIQAFKEWGASKGIEQEGTRRLPEQLCLWGFDEI